jgi:hypothetical protein
LPPSLELKNKPSKEAALSRQLAELQAASLFGFFLDLDDGGNTFPCKVSCFSVDYTALCPEDGSDVSVIHVAKE